MRASYESLSVPAPASAEGRAVALVAELDVCVSAAVEVDDGLHGRCWEYTVQTRSSLPSYGCAQCSVRRRAQDFARLRARLRAFCPGVLVPALPAAARVADGRGWGCAGGADGPPAGGGASQQPGEPARTALQHFCAAVAAHPLLRECPDLALFLLEGPEGYPPDKGPASSTSSAAPPGLAPSWFERGGAASAVATTLASLLDRLALAGAPTGAELSSSAGDAARHRGATEADRLLGEAAAYVAALEEHLDCIADAVSASAATARAHAAALRQLHAAAAALGAPEADLSGTAALANQQSASRAALAASSAGGAGPPALDGLGAALTAVGAASADAAAPLLDAADALESCTACPLRLAARSAAAAREVLDDRARAAARVVAEEAQHGAALDAEAPAGDGAADVAARVQREQDISAAAAALEAARCVFDDVAGRCAAELPRCHAQLARQVDVALRAFAGAHAAAAKAQALAWARLVPGAAEVPLPARPAD